MVQVMKQMKQMNLDELRIILTDEIGKLRDGTTSPAAVNAISNASGKYLSSVKLELEIYKMTGKQPELNKVLPARASTRDKSKKES